MSDKAPNYGVFIAILLVLFFSMSTVAAHQPRLETSTNVSMNNPIVVHNPEISQAFYSTLRGSPDYYKISSNVSFKLYLNLLVPTSPGILADFVSAQVMDTNGNILLTLNGTQLGPLTLKNSLETIILKVQRQPNSFQLERTLLRSITQKIRESTLLQLVILNHFQ